MLLLVIVLSFSMALFAGGGQESEEPAAAASEVEAVKLTFATWRTEDVAVYEELFDKFEAENPGVEITIKATKTEEYHTTLATGFKGGTSADLLHLRAYGNFEQFAAPGYLMPIEGKVPELGSFSGPSLLGSTAVKDGKIYGVPYASQTLGIYYNTDIYEEVGLSEPETWDEFLSNCEKLKAAGYTAIANGTATGWMDEVMHGVICPNFYGANDFYEELVAGDTTFEDARYRTALEKLMELTPYMPEGFAGIDYINSQMLFLNGIAVHFIGGSWENAYFGTQNPDLNMKFIAGPAAKKGDKRYVSTFVDGSFGIWADTPYEEESVAWLRFMARKETGEFLMEKLGVKSENPNVTTSDPFLTMVINLGKTSTPYIHLVGFRYKEPTGSSLLQAGLQAYLSGDIDSYKMVEDLQNGVATYYEPFQK